MALRGNYPVCVEFERRRVTEALRRRLVAAQDTALMLTLGCGVCLSWPQVARSMVLATRIVLFYLFSPR
jgi:hypothetical protein